MNEGWGSSDPDPCPGLLALSVDSDPVFFMFVFLLCFLAQLRKNKEKETVNLGRNLC